MERTEAQWMVLHYMRGACDVVPLEDQVISRVLDELVQQGDLTVVSPIIGRTFEYSLTEQGRTGKDDPPEAELLPVEPDRPLTPAEGRHLSFSKTRGDTD